jgi:hypothetical protein
MYKYDGDGADAKMTLWYRSTINYLSTSNFMDRIYTTGPELPILNDEYNHNQL